MEEAIWGEGGGVHLNTKAYDNAMVVFLPFLFLEKTPQKNLMESVTLLRNKFFFKDKKQRNKKLISIFSVNL